MKTIINNAKFAFIALMFVFLGASCIPKKSCVVDYEALKGKNYAAISIANHSSQGLSIYQLDNDFHPDITCNNYMLLPGEHHLHFTFHASYANTKAHTIPFDVVAGRHYKISAAPDYYSNNVKVIIMDMETLQNVAKNSRSFPFIQY